MEFGLNQSQSTTMSAQLQQSIKLLQMTTIDLTNFINNELQNNPLLNQESFEEKSSISKPETQIEVDKKQDSWKEEDRHYDVSNKSENNEGFDFDRLTNKISLKSYLVDQINIEINEKDRKIALYLVDNLDSKGFLIDPIEEIAAKIKIPLNKIINIIKQLQKLEPVGVFARDLKDCLRIQLKDKNQLSKEIEILLDNLELIAAGEIKKLSDLCSIEEKEVFELIHIIKTLNPKPGLEFETEDEIHIQPDVTLRKIGDEFRVELNKERLPKLIVNKQYYKEVKKNLNGQEKQYLSKQYNNANWLINSLEQRANTVLRVAEQIVIKQRDFFIDGIEKLNPLSLSEIAEEIQMNESSISRAVNGKYMLTDMGVFELKYFFSSSIQTAEGDISSLAIKQKIKQLIDKEDVSKPLSDEKIAKILKEQNIVIARRTVAKYRESLKIATSAERKRLNKLK